MSYGTRGYKWPNGARATNEEVPAFSGTEVYLPILGPTGVSVWGTLGEVRAVKGDDDFDTISIGEAF